MSTRLLVALALAVAVGLAVAASPFASGAPDGLNRVAEEKGFSGDGRLAPAQEEAPVAGYAFPGVEDERVAKGLAGLVGALGVFVVGSGVARLTTRGRRASPSARPPSS